VNSTLDLEEVLHLVANEVAAALEADACFVYLYDDGAGELVLRATHGTPLDEMTRRPRLRPGEGITGTAAATSLATRCSTSSRSSVEFTAAIVSVSSRRCRSVVSTCLS
jgi:signal transduction protein with GAF and PtsI domain